MQLPNDLNSGEISDNDKLLAALAYPVSFLVSGVILLGENKNRPFQRYHAVQALAFNVILYLVMIVLGATVVLACITPFLWLISLYPAWKAYQGEYVTLPWITDFIRRQGWV